MGESIPGRNTNRGRNSLLKGLKSPVVAGLVATVPLLSVFVVSKWFLGFFQSIPGNQLFYLTSIPILNQVIKAATISVVGGLLIVGVGKVVSTSGGIRLEEKIDFLFMKIPIIGAVYSITKTATDTVLRGAEEFKHPVKLSYHGMKFTAFQTGNCASEGKRTVFVPTSPNVTSGFVIEVDEDCVEETDESLEKAFTRVLSAGFSN